jgi:hypothetical protein
VRKTVTMHQPNYLPWIGLFSKISQTDCFVIMDNFQYTKNGVTHRNKVRTNVGSHYLTIPIEKKFTRSIIKDVELPSDRKWQELHWMTIYHEYLKSDFFSGHADFFKELYFKNFFYLWQINMEIIRYLLKCFEINVEIITASELNLPEDLKHTDMIVGVMKKIGATTYLSGPSGKGYLEMEKFPQNGMICKFAKFEHPVYKQRYAGFEPNLAAIDLLFNTGPNSGEIVRKSGRIED